MHQQLIFLPLFVLGAFIFMNHTHAQSFDRKVVASAGKDAKNQAILYQNIRYMTYTIGEPIIFGAATPAYRLGNGFIQPAGISAVAPPAVTAITQQNDTYLVYPNPFDEELMIAAPEESVDTVKLQLIDQHGKLIMETQMIDQKTQLTIPEHCAPGIYWLNIYRLDGTFLQQNKLVKQRTANGNTPSY
jgi:hypothetical protein